jgi:acetyltransferase
LGERATRALDALLPPPLPRRNPVDVRGDASAARFADAVAAVLADEDVDAVLALHVPRPATGAADTAHAVAAVARDAAKPVLAAWLGAIDKPSVKEALDAGRVANFYTPENAVDAFSFLAAYRRNQQWLLEVPPSHPEPSPPDLAAAEKVRRRAERAPLPPGDAHKLLAAFGIACVATRIVRTLPQAQAAARELGYPVALTVQDGEPVERAGLPNRRALERAFRELRPQRQHRFGRVAVQPSARAGASGACAVMLVHDQVFGPVIGVGPASRGVATAQPRAVMLPPLSRRLATDLLRASGMTAHEALVTLVQQVSSIACLLPWVRAIALDPVVVVGDRVEVAWARVDVDPARIGDIDYRHMAIHPYPVELEGTLALPDGTPLAVRPVRPEDAEIERRFVAGLSEETRYFRFFYRLHELTPAMIGRFTQVDYDREVALLALTPDASSPGGQAIVGIARYIGKLDRVTAEFAVVVADAWQRRGVASALMHALMSAAARKGVQELHGVVLRSNQNMLRFVRRLGFAVNDDPDDPEQVIAVRTLQPAAEGGRGIQSGRALLKDRAPARSSRRKT